VFSSLGCCVTIGNLNVSISDKSLQKTVGLTSQYITVKALDEALPDGAEESCELETALTQLQQQITIIEITTVSAAAYASAFAVLYSITRTVGKSHSLFNRFLFIHI
jgi:hypothetical protein